jgi:hypothetical protein
MTEKFARFSFTEKQVELLIECLKEAPVDIRVRDTYEDVLEKLELELSRLGLDV